MGFETPLSPSHALSNFCPALPQKDKAVPVWFSVSVQSDLYVISTLTSLPTAFLVDCGSSFVYAWENTSLLTVFQTIGLEQCSVVKSIYCFF